MNSEVINQYHRMLENPDIEPDVKRGIESMLAYEKSQPNEHLKYETTTVFYAEHSLADTYIAKQVSEAKTTQEAQELLKQTAISLQYNYSENNEGVIMTIIELNADHLQLFNNNTIYADLSQHLQQEKFDLDKDKPMMTPRSFLPASLVLNNQSDAN